VDYNQVGRYLRDNHFQRYGGNPVLYDLSIYPTLLEWRKHFIHRDVLTKRAIDERWPIRKLADEAGISYGAARARILYYKRRTGMNPTKRFCARCGQPSQSFNQIYRGQTMCVQCRKALGQVKEQTHRIKRLYPDFFTLAEERAYIKATYDHDDTALASLCKCHGAGICPVCKLQEMRKAFA
jgi:hypothetical protein